MTWTQEIDGWLQACQKAGGLHILSGLPDPGKAPSIAFVCIPRFPGHPIPDDLRVRLRPDQFFKRVERFPGFPKIVTMIGDGWHYWNAYLSMLPERDWARRRFGDAIRITVHISLSDDLLVQLLLHENLIEGARFILVQANNDVYVALFDNPKVNAVYAIQRIPSAPALDVFHKFVKEHKLEQIEDTSTIVDFELLCWMIRREVSARLPP